MMLTNNSNSHKKYVFTFYIGHLNQPTQKKYYFYINCLRRSTQKIKSIFYINYLK
jgi:hypothetical protein